MILAKRTMLAILAVLFACVLGLAALQAPSYADEPAEDAPQAADQAADQAAQEQAAQEQAAQGSEAAAPASSDAAEPAPASSEAGQAPSSEGQPAPEQASSEAQEASAPEQAAEEASSQPDEKASSDEKAAEDEKKTTEAQDEERQKKVDELQEKVDEKVEVALEAVAKANELANSLPGALDKLAQAYAPLDEQRDSYSGLLVQGTSLNEQIMASEQRIASLEVVLQQTREEMSHDVDIDLGELLRGELDLAELESMPYLLGKLADFHEKSLAEAKAGRTQIQTQRTELDPVIEQAHAQVGTAIYDGNVAAFEVESICSEVRQLDKEAADALEEAQKELDKELETLEEEHEKAVEEAEAKAKASSSTDAAQAAAVPELITAEDIEGLEDAKNSVAEARSWHDADRSAAQDQAGAWYDSVDALSSTVVDTPSFGVGDDFALSESVFVTKWGNAIDQFYANWSQTTGTKSPMQGLGKAMARCAYERRIDPRLCAAVSIVESSGGLHCIKPFNAWGWGAADSDPEGLAFGWSAWDEAIDAWHTGVATNQVGLGHPVSLSGFGDTYCSTPIWGKNVAGYMLQISDLAKDDTTQAQDGQADATELGNVGSNAVDVSQLSTSL